MVRFNLPIPDSRAQELLALDGVSAVGEGQRRGQPVIVVTISDPSVARRLPGSINGVPVVTEVDSAPGLAAPGLPLADDNPQQLPRPVSSGTVARHRPVPAGVSIGHKDITAGSSSFLATDGSKVYQLSNSHVLAQYGQANVGDAILQPGKADGGTESDDAVGQLAGHVPVNQSDNLVDLAWYEPSVNVSDEIRNVGVPIAETQDPEVGDTVTFAGRTSGVTQAKVDQANVVIQLGGSGRTFTNQFRIDKPLIPGDSGSPVVVHTDNGPRPAGLGFAATNQVGFCNYISSVEEESGLSIIPTAGDVPGETTSGISPEAVALVLGLGGLAWLARR